MAQARCVLGALTEAEIGAVRAALDVGIQWRRKVPLSGAGHLVTQVYATALPVAYSAHPASLGHRLAQLVLEDASKATLRAAALNTERTENNTVYQTLLCGGTLGNDIDWIIEALWHALSACSPSPSRLSS